MLMFDVDVVNGRAVKGVWSPSHRGNAVSCHVTHIIETSIAFFFFLILQGNFDPCWSRLTTASNSVEMI